MQFQAQDRMPLHCQKIREDGTFVTLTLSDPTAILILDNSVRFLAWQAKMKVKRAVCTL